MAATTQEQICKAMVRRIRIARQFFHRSYPATLNEVHRFNRRVREFLERFGKDDELARFDDLWEDAFLTTPVDGRVEKDWDWVENGDLPEGQIGHCHPGRARQALYLLTAVIRRHAASFEQSTVMEVSAQALETPPPREAAAAVLNPSELSSREERRQQVDNFIQNVLKEEHVKICRADIWRAAKHTTPRQFEHWQAGDKKATASDDINFRRVLKTNPSDFVKQLDRSSKKSET